MALKEQLQKLATEKNTPCVTISLNTHRTHPDNLKDEVVLKKLLKEAEERVINEFGKRDVAPLLQKLQDIPKDIDINYLLDSLHIFLSNDTKEIIKSSWPCSSEGVHISDSFAVRPIINAYNRNESYLLMLLSQSGVHLYEALNDDIVQEIKNEDFPFSENKHYATHADKGSDPKHIDDLVREFLNKVDKALVKVHYETDLQCVVICTEDNYSRLLQVADKASVYQGYAAIDYNNTATHYIAKQSWQIIKVLQQEARTKAIEDMKESVAKGKVVTDIQEIYQAAIDGRGEILIVHQDFSQAVIMTSDRTFDLIEDVTQKNAIDDITSNIAWELIAKKGKVFFTTQDEIKDLGNMVLKTRY